MFLKKSFISVSAIQEEQSLNSNQNQPHISAFPSSFYFEYPDNQNEQYKKKPLQANNTFHRDSKPRYEKKIKTESSHMDFESNSLQKNFFSGQSFRNLQQNNQNFSYDSMKRQYETKLQKQKQFYQLKQWKYKQEIQNLANQISILTSKVQSNKQRQTSQQTIISPSESRLTQISKNSNVATQQFNEHLKKMLKRVEKDHQQCIQTKKSLLKQIQSYRLRYSALEDRMKSIQQQLNQKNQRIKQLNIQNDSLSQKLLKDKAKSENQEKSMNKIIQELQMRMDQSKFQNQAFKRQVSVAKKGKNQIQPKQNRAIKILNNCFSFTKKQNNNKYQNVAEFYGRSQNSQPDYSTDRQLVNQMYYKSMSFIKDDSVQKQHKFDYIRDRFREALKKDEKDKISKENKEQQKKSQTYQSYKGINFHKRQTALRFKYL